MGSRLQHLDAPCGLARRQESQGHLVVPSKRRSSTQQGLVVFAKNKKRVAAFYQQTLGLAVEESETSHDLLRGHGYEDVVHAIPRKHAAGIKIAKPPVPREWSFRGRPRPTSTVGLALRWRSPRVLDRQRS